jgi:hypothetical protein
MKKESPMLHPVSRTVVLLTLLLACAAPWAAAEIRPDHPQSYTVKSGDTLWGIAGRFLQNPWQWQEIWQANPKIKNPDLIYPGDVLELVYVDGKPRLRRKASNRGNTVKLSPRVRSDQAIPPIPLEVIEPFLSRPVVLDPDELDNGPHVIAFPDGNLVGGEGMRAYVHSLAKSPVGTWDIFRRGKSYYDVDTDELLGYAARPVGTATLTSGAEPATVRIDTTEIEVRIGDRLVHRRIMEKPPYFFPKTPEKPMDGRILDAYDTIGMVGRNQIVLISLGANNGLETGDVLLVNNIGRTVRDKVGPLAEQRVEDEVGGVQRFSLIPPEIRLPDERAGAAMVFQVYDKLSVALIMESTRLIRVGDRVFNP